MPKVLQKFWQSAQGCVSCLLKSGVPCVREGVCLSEGQAGRVNITQDDAALRKQRSGRALAKVRLRCFIFSN
jgi:hypothetical protein